MKLITYIYKGIWLCGFRMMNIWNTVRLWMRLSGSGVDFHFDVRGFGLTWLCEKSGTYVYDKAKTIAKMKALAGIK